MRRDNHIFWKNEREIFLRRGLEHAHGDARARTGLPAPKRPAIPPAGRTPSGLDAPWRGAPTIDVDAPPVGEGYF
jgi:hypothetical protein